MVAGSLSSNYMTNERERSGLVVLVVAAPPDAGFIAPAWRPIILLGVVICQTIEMRDLFNKRSFMVALIHKADELHVRSRPHGSTKTWRGAVGPAAKPSAPSHI
jgi:hypothetical protein